MICPSCGAETNGTKFCENCGSPLVVEPVQVNEPVPEPVPQNPAPQAAVPVAGAPEPPVSAAGFSQQAAGASQPQYQQAPAYQMPSANRAPNAAFVLVIVGLVLSVLFVTFVPGIVCSIIGIVLNAGYTKKGLDNPRKTSTTVIGVIGLVVGVLCLAFTIAVSVFAAQVVDEADRQGIDITSEGVTVTTDSDGKISIKVDGASSSAASSSTASKSQASAGSATSSQAAVYEDDKYHDAEWNPTLFAVIELSGAEMADLLDHFNFSWDKTISSWTASDGSQFGAYDASGLLGKDKLAALPKGAAGQAVAFGLTVEGYDSPTEAFNALTNDVVTEDMYGDDDVFFAVVYGPSMVRHLVAVTETDVDEQTFLLFTEESISGGVFEEIIGVNAGSTMDEVWQAITGGSHIGGYIGG